MVSLIRSKNLPLVAYSVVVTPWFPDGRLLVYGGGHLFYGPQTQRFKFL